MALLLAVYLILALTSAFTTPWNWRETPELTPPDESAHLEYVRFLAQSRVLPTFTTSGGNYEAHQPPLYYLVALIPYLAARSHGDAAVIHSIRVLSVLIGGGLIFVLHLLARRLFPHSPALQLAVPAFAAFLPMHLAVLSAISNDGAVELFATSALYVCVVGLQQGFTALRASTLGALLGLGLLTKTGCLLFVPVALLAIAYVGGRGQRLRPLRALGLVAACLGVVLLMTGWWFARNQALYGDPLAARAFRVIFNDGTRRTPDWFFTEAGISAGAYWMLVAIQTFESFWGVFGQANQFMAEWFYVIGALLALPPIIGLVRAYVIAQRGAGDLDVSARRAFVCFALATALVAMSFLKFNTEFFQAQARYLFTAIAPMAVFFCYGWVALIPQPAGQRSARKPVSGDRRAPILAAVIAIVFVMSVCSLAPGMRSRHVPFIPGILAAASATLSPAAESPVIS
ncbi:MAG: glycosyltransferase family 39 protein [Armatimonadota bacterium]